MNNSTFSTRDIHLAAYILAKGIPLIEIAPVDNHHCKFVFEKPPRELIEYWVSNAAWERSLIGSYRHLVADSRKILYGSGGG